ncbi:cytochrome P450 [Bradyrhizobium sp. B097]|uniref:cytochrome P450 n=1 Tax=Bradyrhizobium sp. B097 TaxID=3140244 RepID=UPI0031837EF2
MSTASILPSSAEWSMLSLADRDPFSTYDELRRRGKVVWDPGMDSWLVLSYDICRAIETDEATYRILPVDAPAVTFEIKGDLARTGVSSLVGEEHARMRRFYLKLLSPAHMPAYRVGHVLPAVNHLIDLFAGKGSAELASQLAFEVPNRVMGSLFGLPWKDDALMADVSQWHKDIVASLGVKYANDELNRKALRASAELNRLFVPLILERKNRRGNDLISELWTRAEAEYGEVGVDHLVGIVRELVIGAGETTANAIANAIYLFLSDPGLHDAVTRDQEGTLNAFVEEVLRLFGSVQWRFRKANRDVTLAGAEIKKDDIICLLHAAANRDPEHFACPHMADLKRTPPTDHLAFNVGPRICLGMHLARLLIRETLKALIARLPNLRLDPTKEPPTFRAFSHRSYGPLHVVF